ncbi:MAG: HAMP domain-containing sensor histidine kinase [Acidobacteriota bacterium]
MKVATKVATGSGLLIALLIAVLVYNLLLFRQLVDVQRDLSTVRYAAAQSAAQQNRLIVEIEDSLRKLYATRDVAYAGQLRDYVEEFEGELEALETLELPDELLGPVATQRRLWESADVLSIATGATQGELVDGILPLRRLDLRRLQAQADRFGEALELSVDREVRESAESRREIERLALIALAISLALALVVLLLTVRSIHRPIDRLVRATRAVADGEFDHKVELPSDDEFSDLVSDFNRMVARIGEIDRMKRDFVSKVSHDLKTPLVAMQETNNLLLQELPGPLNSKQRRLLELNQGGGERLSGMLSKLLDVARLESDGLVYDFKRQDLREMLEGLVARFGVAAREAGRKLVVDIPERPFEIDFDRDRLLQVFENLLENSLKFSPEGSEIVIGVSTQRPPPSPARRRALRSSWVTISVADRGPGVPDQHKSGIFKEFQQLRLAGQGRDGVGLGLAICREITEAHRGAVWVEDNPGGGSIFRVSIPRSRPGSVRSRAVPKMSTLRSSRATSS